VKVVSTMRVRLNLPKQGLAPVYEPGASPC
jgi:hypothetical protein